MNKEFRQDYCISFIPVSNGVPDILHCEQIFLPLRPQKADKLKKMFDENNTVDATLKILIEDFKK